MSSVPCSMYILFQVIASQREQDCLMDGLVYLLVGDSYSSVSVLNGVIYCLISYTDCSY